MKVYHFAQYSAEYWETRRGIPTASCADKIITPAKGKLSAQADKYICRLIADRIHFDPNMMTNNPMTAAMRNGVTCEPDARNWYSMDRDVSVRQVGFCMTDDGKFGASPDGLIESAPDIYEGGLELKVPDTGTHVGYLLGQCLPDDYKPQVHMQLIVTGLPWVDFVSYRAGYDPFLIRVEPDDFTDILREVLDEFYEKYRRCWEQFETSYHNAPAKAQFEVPDWLQDPPKQEAAYV